MAGDGQDRAHALGLGEGFLPTRPKTIACNPTIPHKITDVPIYDGGPDTPRHGAEFRRMPLPRTLVNNFQTDQFSPGRICRSMAHRHRHDDGGEHAHAEGAVDPSIATSERGIWAVKWSFVGLFATAVMQAIVVTLSGSVALLSDTIH